MQLSPVEAAQKQVKKKITQIKRNKFLEESYFLYCEEESKDGKPPR